MVTIFSKQSCPQCDFSKRILDQHNIAYVEKRIDEDPNSLAYIKELGYLQVPVILTPEGEHWSGLQPDRIKALAQ